MPILPKRFYLRDSLTVARELIGKLIVRELGGSRMTVRIVETEAYDQGDPASHSYRGRTARTAPMFEEGGICYVYFIYGMYDCFNVVTGSSGHGSAVLVRAAEPLDGTHKMWRNRFPGKPVPEDLPDALAGCGTGHPIVHSAVPLTNGPGKLARALAFSARRDSGMSLLRVPEAPGMNRASLRDDGFRPHAIVQTTRIGISTGTEQPWRFYLDGSPYVSDYRSRISMMRSRSSREK